MESFDVGLVRRYMERQKEDAEIIIALSDALASTIKERDALRAAASAPAAPAPAAPESKP